MANHPRAVFCVFVSEKWRAPFYRKSCEENSCMIYTNVKRQGLEVSALDLYGRCVSDNGVFLADYQSR
jgi:hypothetical protein